MVIIYPSKYNTRDYMSRIVYVVLRECNAREYRGREVYIILRECNTGVYTRSSE